MWISLSRKDDSLMISAIKWNGINCISYVLNFAASLIVGSGKKTSDIKHNAYNKDAYEIPILTKLIFL